MRIETKEHNCYFTVCGEGLTKIVRDLYCYEGKQQQAMDILDNLDGITLRQARNVCEGLAQLEDKPNDPMIYYSETPDRKFREKYEAHQRWLIEEYLPKLKQEQIEIQKAMEKTRDKFEDTYTVTEKYREDVDIISRLTQERTKFEKQLNRSSETIKVGQWDVPKDLLDRYANHVVKRIRTTMRSRIIPTTTEDVMDLYNLELERQDLHAAICKSVGFDHDADEQSQDQRDFDYAISDYLDKHAGSLFNGGDD